MDKAFAVYENLLDSDPDTLSAFERYQLIKDGQQFKNDVKAAGDAGAIPSSALLSTAPYVVEGGYDRKLMAQEIGRGFKFQDEDGKIIMGVPKQSSLQDKKKDVLQIIYDDQGEIDPVASDFVFLEDIEVFDF